MAERVVANETIVKHPQEALDLVFDFTNLLGSETLTGTITVTDDSASALTLGTAAFVTGNKKITVPVSAGTAGARYRLTCKCADTGGETRVVVGVLEIRDGDGVC